MAASSTAPFESRSSSSGTVAGSRSRRDLFAALGAIGAAALVAARPRAAHAAPPDVSSDIDPNSLINKLVRRITFGYSDAEFAAASALGYPAYLEQQLNPDSITEDPSLDAALANLTTLTMTLPQLYAQAQTNGGLMINELIEAKIRRAVSSKKQPRTGDGTLRELERLNSLGFLYTHGNAGPADRAISCGPHECHGAHQRRRGGRPRRGPAAPALGV